MKTFIKESLKNYKNLSFPSKILLLETLICENCSEEHILQVYQSDDFSNNDNLYKWVCAYGSENLIKKMASGLKLDLYGSVNAAIINYNTQTFHYLLNEHKDFVLQDKFFSQAITRAEGYNYTGIVSMFLANLDKILDLDERNIERCLSYNSRDSYHISAYDKMNIEKYNLKKQLKTQAVNAALTS